LHPLFFGPGIYHQATQNIVGFKLCQGLKFHCTKFSRLLFEAMAVMCNKFATFELWKELRNHRQKGYHTMIQLVLSVINAF
jgi:hypothetical protein